MKKGKKLPRLGKPKRKSYREMYFEIIKSVRPLISNRETLEQPHVSKFVDTVTTYGAYQKPV